MKTKRIASWVLASLFGGMTLLVSLGIATKTAVSNPPAGPLVGDFQVNANGEATYTIDLVVPPGTQNMAPNLSLAYQSQTSGGTLGKGFGLSGLSSITRTGAQPDVDGFRGGVAYTANDRFQIDGNRLILVSGAANGASGSVYHTQIESWRKVVAQGQCGSGPCSFTVTDKKGHQYQYGATTDSRVLAYGAPFANGGSKQGSVREWLLNSVTDLNGNTISFTYTSTPRGTNGQPVVDGSNTGQAYPDRIDYTSNANLAAHRNVQFFYELRPDSAPQFQGGAKVATLARLVQIRTYVANADGDSTLATGYGIAYDPQSPQQMSQIARINQFAANGDTLSPTTFQWTGSANGLVVQQGFPYGGTSTNTGWAGDFNGDGITDLLPKGTSNTSTAYFGSPSGFKTVALNPIPNLSTTTFTGDFNADGMDDLLTIGGSTGRMYFANGNGFGNYVSTPSISMGTSCVCAWVGDYNGDAHADLLTRNGSALNLYIGDTAQNGLVKVSNFSYTGINLSTGVTWAMDLNGDGLTDLANLQNTSATVFFSNLSQGTGFAAGVTTSGLSLNTSCPACTLPTDVNGDGLPDLLGKNGTAYTVYYNTGAGFQTGRPAPGLKAGNINNWSGDFNGDGLIDFYYSGNGGDTLLYATGLGFQNQPVTDLGLSTSGTWSGDFNGDGLTDLFDAGTKTMYFGGSPAAPPTTPARNQIPHLLTRIATGVGTQWTIAYAPMTDTTVYMVGEGGHSPGAFLPNRTTAIPAALSGSAYPGNTLNPGMGVTPYPVRLVHSAQYVAAQYTVAVGGGQQYPYAYTYKNGRMDMGGQGWLGFETVTQQDQTLGKLTRFTFLQDFPFTGSVVAQEVMCDPAYASDPHCTPNALISAQTTTYWGTGQKLSGSQQKAFQPYPGVYQVLKASSQQWAYDYGRLAYGTGTTYGYDGFGNQLAESYLGYIGDHGQDLSPSDNVYSLATYQNDTNGGDWLVGFVRNQLQSTSSDTTGLGVCACGGNSPFNANDFTLTSTTYSSDGRMSIAQSCQWDNTNNVWLSTTYSYDAYGNDTLKVSPAGGVTRTTYDPQYQTYAASTAIAGANPGQTLTTYSGFDPRFGIQVANTDPNGNTHITVLDGFGRTAILQGPLPDTLAPPASTNAVTPWVTGTQNFQAASVVTVQTQQWVSNDSGYYNQVNALQSWQNATWAFSRTFYNGLQQAVAQVLQGSSQDPANVVTRTRYDATGTVLGKTNAYFQGQTAYWNTAQYDIYGRPSRIVVRRGTNGQDSTVAAAAYAYNTVGTVATQTLGSGGTTYTRIFTQRTYNGQSYADSIIVPADSNATTCFGYDALGRTTSIRAPLTAANPQGLTTQYQYDALSRRIETNAPGLGSLRAVYGPNGQLKNLVDAYGTSTFTFDPENRLLTEEWYDGKVLAYTYDNATRANGLGALASVSIKGGNGQQQSSFQFAYDPYGNTASEWTWIAGSPVTFRTQRGYDPQFRPIWQVNPDGTQLTTTYDRAQLRAVGIGGTNYATYTNYNAQGQAGQVAFNNGVTTNIRYGVEGNELSRKIAKGTAVYFYDSTIWNGLSQVTSVQDLLPTNGNLSQTFAYQNLRLSTASAPGSYGNITYRYDPSGNLLQKGEMQFSYTGYQASSGTGAEGIAFNAQYDSLGNMRQRYIDGRVWNFTYDAERQLTSAVNASKKDTLTYLYDYHGNRIKKLDPEGTATFYINPSFEIVAQKGGSGQATNYVIGQEGRIASVTKGKKVVQQPGLPLPGTNYFQTDRLGSTAITTDAAGDTASAALYDPFGGLVAFRGEDDYRYKFAGEELDEGTGLYYLNARYYDPFLGRFTSADSRAGGHRYQQDVWNRYEYVLGDPVRYTDPSGHGVGADIVDGLVIGLSVALDVVAPELIPETAELDFVVVEGTEAVTETAEIAEDLTAAGEAAAGCGCFARATTVETPEGPKPIQDIQVGDTVIAFDPASGKASPKPVTHIYRLQRDHINHLYYDGQEIKASDDHPFLTPQGWRPAGKLQAGDSLKKADGSWTLLDSTRRIEGHNTVFNFTVADLHTFEAGPDPLVVHNVHCPITRRTYVDLVNNTTSDVIDADVGPEHWRGGTPTTDDTRYYARYEAPRPQRIDYVYDVYDPANNAIIDHDGMRGVPNQILPGQQPDAGHIIGNQFGGLGNDRRYIFPQNLYINRGWQGTYDLWRWHENNITAYIRQGYRVRLQVTLWY